MKEKKLKLNETHQNSYCDMPELNLHRNELELTLDEAVLHIFEILNISAPSAKQTRFARAEIQLAKRNRTFSKLVFLLSSLMGNSEHYYNNHYTFV